MEGQRGGKLSDQCSSGERKRGGAKRRETQRPVWFRGKGRKEHSILSKEMDIGERRSKEAGKLGVNKLKGYGGRGGEPGVGKGGEEN